MNHSICQNKERGTITKIKRATVARAKSALISSVSHCSFREISTKAKVLAFRAEQAVKDINCPHRTRQTLPSQENREPKLNNNYFIHDEEAIRKRAKFVGDSLDMQTMTDQENLLGDVNPSVR